MDKFSQMCADVFHFLAGVRVGVRDAVDDLVEVVVFFDDIEGCAIVDVKEVSDVGDPVIHSGDALPHRGQEHRPPQRTLHRRRKEILPRKSLRPGGSGENRIIIC